MNHLSTSTSYIFLSTCFTGRLPYAATSGLHPIYTDFYIHRCVACLVNEIHFLQHLRGMGLIPFPDVGEVARLTVPTFQALYKEPALVSPFNHFSDFRHPTSAEVSSVLLVARRRTTWPHTFQNMTVQNMMTWCWVVAVVQLYPNTEYCSYCSCSLSLGWNHRGHRRNPASVDPRCGDIWKRRLKMHENVWKLHQSRIHMNTQQSVGILQGHDRRMGVLLHKAPEIRGAERNQRGAKARLPTEVGQYPDQQISEKSNGCYL